MLTRQETWLNVADSDVSGIDSSFEGDGALVGLPYLEKQKSGQWMATLQEAKFMGFSIIFITKSGRLNSVLDLILEGKDELLKERKKG